MCSINIVITYAAIECQDCILVLHNAIFKESSAYTKYLCTCVPHEKGLNTICVQCPVIMLAATSTYHIGGVIQRVHDNRTNN